MSVAKSVAVVIVGVLLSCVAAQAFADDGWPPVITRSTTTVTVTVPPPPPTK